MPEPVRGINQYNETTDEKTWMELPKHIGLIPERLLATKRMSNNGCMEKIYEVCADIHNKAEYAGEKTFVWGAGNAHTARILFIGEAPGWQEDRYAMPFIGESGQFISTVCKMAGLCRVDEAFFINTTTVRPDYLSGTKKIGAPSTLELAQQRPRVVAVASLLNQRERPLDAVVCLGKYAYAQLFCQKRLLAAVKAGTEVNMRDIILSRVKGWHPDTVMDVDAPILVMNHPSYVLRKIKNSHLRPSKLPEVIEYVEMFKLLKEKINGKRQVQAQ